MLQLILINEDQFKVSIDLTKNRIYVKINYFKNIHEFTKWTIETQYAISIVKYKYTMITDLLESQITKLSINQIEQLNFLYTYMQTKRPCSHIRVGNTKSVEVFSCEASKYGLTSGCASNMIDAIKYIDQN